MASSSQSENDSATVPEMNLTGESQSENNSAKMPEMNPNGESQSGNDSAKTPETDLTGESQSENDSAKTPEMDLTGESQSENDSAKTPEMNLTSKSQSENNSTKMPEMDHAGESQFENVSAKTPEMNLTNESQSKNDSEKMSEMDLTGASQSENDSAKVPEMNITVESQSENDSAKVSEMDITGESQSENNSAKMPEMDPTGESQSENDSAKVPEMDTTDESQSENDSAKTPEMDLTGESQSENDSAKVSEMDITGDDEIEVIAHTVSGLPLANSVRKKALKPKPISSNASSSSNSNSEEILEQEVIQTSSSRRKQIFHISKLPSGLKRLVMPSSSKHVPILPKYKSIVGSGQPSKSTITNQVTIPAAASKAGSAIATGPVKSTGVQQIISQPPNYVLVQTNAGLQLMPAVNLNGNLFVKPLNKFVSPGGKLLPVKVKPSPPGSVQPPIKRLIPTVQPASTKNILIQRANKKCVSVPVQRPSKTVTLKSLVHNLPRVQFPANASILRSHLTSSPSAPVSNTKDTAEAVKKNFQSYELNLCHKNVLPNPPLSKPPPLHYFKFDRSTKCKHPTCVAYTEKVEQALRKKLLHHNRKLKAFRMMKHRRLKTVVALKKKIRTLEKQKEMYDKLESMPDKFLKMLLRAHLNNLSINKNRSQFGEELKEFVTNLHTISPEAYEILRKIFDKTLPETMTVQKWARREIAVAEKIVDSSNSNPIKRGREQSRQRWEIEVEQIDLDSEDEAGVDEAESTDNE